MSGIGILTVKSCLCRREAKERKAETTAERAKEEEAAAPSAIDEAAENMVANQRQTVYGGVSPLTLTAGTGRVERGGKDGAMGGDGAVLHFLE